MKMKKDKIEESKLEAIIDVAGNYFKKNIYSDINTYDRLIDAIDEFFFQIREGNINFAYAKMDNDYLDYKGIKNIEEFKEFLSVLNYDNTSFDIIKYKYLDIENIYVCNVVTFTTQYGEEYESSEDYAMNKKENTDTFSVVLKENDDFKIAFEGFVSSYVLDAKHYITDMFELMPTRVLKFDEKYVIMLQINNKTNLSVSPVYFIDNIVGFDNNDGVYWADELPNTLDYDMLPGEKGYCIVVIRHGGYDLHSMHIRFNKSLDVPSATFKITPMFYQN